jgi:hypothetical protein
MRSRSALAGVGSIAFSVLTIVGLALANPPGGTYKASDAAKYVAKGHHVAVFASVYVLLLAVLGLLLLLAYLRDLLSAAPDGERVARIFWAMGIGAATSFAVGWRSSSAMRSRTPSAGAALSSIRPSLTSHPSSVSASSSGLPRSCWGLH